MPATLPWPKIANTPPKSGAALVAVRRAAPRDSGRAPAPSSVGSSRHARSCRARRRARAPCVDQRFEVGADRVASSAASSMRAGEPLRRRLPGTSCGRRRSRGTSCCARASREACRERVDRRIEAEQHDAAAMRIALGDQRVDRRPLRRVHRLELPPLGIDVEVVEALQRAVARCPGSRGIDFGGMISSSSSWPLACTAS